MNYTIGGNDMISDLSLSIDYSKRRCIRLNEDKKDRRLVVFGDSFFETNEIPHLEISWTIRLADSLDRSLLNYALHGTSLNYSVQMLFHYLDTEYDENDIILFGVTSPTRVANLLDDDNRGLHSTALVWLDSSNDITKEQYKYFQKDNKFWKTLLIRGMYIDDIRNQLRLVEEYLNCMKNNTLVLHSFDHLLDSDEFCLIKIVRLENNNNFDNLNHLSDNNKKILARLAYKHLTDRKNKELFDIENYMKEK